MMILSNSKQQIVIFQLFVLLFIIGNYVCHAQSYSNIDNIGQQAFNIIQNMNTVSSKEFKSNFRSGNNVYKQITGENIPSSSFLENYLNLKKKQRKYDILWNRVSYHSFKCYPPIEENGVLGYKSRLYLQYEEKVFYVVVLFIQYEGKFYLISIY